MNLFQCAEAEPHVFSDPTAIRTPLGIVRLKARLSGGTMEEERPTAAYRVQGDGRIIVWEREDLYAELLICHPVFSEPLFWPVQETWGALWHIRANSLTGPIIFWAEWDEGYTWNESSPNSGQFCYAKLWGDGCTDVSIGTQDDEMLALRARKSDYLPAEWEQYFRHQGNGLGACWAGHPIHHYLLQTGVASPLLPLKAGQEIQIQFAVAWAGTDALSSVATAAAVEVSSTEILSTSAEIH